MESFWNNYCVKDFIRGYKEVFVLLVVGGWGDGRFWEVSVFLR